MEARNLMKRFNLLLTLGLVFVLISLNISCGGKKKQDIPSEIPIDTTTVVDETPTDTTPPTPPSMESLKESQFRQVYFDFDKFNLRPDARSSLDFNYDLLKSFPDVIVKIEGHCDERGTVEYNLSLGEKRANAAKGYLVGLGIPSNRISTISYGKERPVDPRHNEEAWGKNRRCEFRIVSQ
jgi:peptidoglycan-associated lipoprotein